MSNQHTSSLAAFMAVEDEVREMERLNGRFATYSQWPRDLLARWREPLHQLRLDRSLIRFHGGEPPALPSRVSQVDDRRFEPLLDRNRGVVGWVQTPEMESPWRRTA